ncbi:MAG: hypothetical protein QNJ31_06905 [Candidatus Caenarcaniphilales bacterium]|nr:hypothetical protein [Candidatus Caenarcaniphilales bacterium]
MELTDILPIISLAFLIIFLLVTNFTNKKLFTKAWLFPAAVSFLFFIFSVYTVWQEGLTGVIAEHTKTLWGNQIWFDLLIGFGLAWFLLLPKARALGMKPFLWLVGILLTGNIAMLARVIYLEEKTVT